MIYEVFLKRDGAVEFRHVGSLDAPNDDLAGTLARECYLRRSEGDRLWLVRRDHLIDPDDGVLVLPATRARRLLDGWDSASADDDEAVHDADPVGVDE